MTLDDLGNGRLLIDPPAAGPWNMAADEILLENAERGQLSLRFYSWLPATLSLGYFQSVRQRAEHAASLRLPLVRRASGGGAIVHDDFEHELTYSLAVPGSPRDHRAQRHLYDVMHRTLVQALARHGVPAQAQPHNPGERSSSPPFLCFLRHTAGDVLLAGHKVAGSAQRRAAGAILQHGSVLIRQSAAAPELPGITQLCQDVQLTARELQAAWLDELGRFWPVHWQHDQLASAERNRVHEKVMNKFDSPHWLLRR